MDEMVKVPHQEARQTTKSYVHLLRGATNLFKPDELERLAPRSRGNVRLADLNGQGISGMDPIAATEAIAYDFLSEGGKHLRPFITLSVFDALTGGKATSPEGTEVIAQMNDGVKRAAMSIETFHKASLVHDDIEDADQFRYGKPAMHCQYGIPTAINVGDYLIGLGYRLVSRDARNLGGDVVADILDYLADAHQRLSEGQGAELIWRDAGDKRITPVEALKIYALKTSPAFEAALYSGFRLAGDAEPYTELIRKFSRDLGVAFQILNDLKDWQGDQDNKLAAGLDLLAGRPTVLWALALEGLEPAKQEELIQIVGDDERAVAYRIDRARQLYAEAGVFDKANRLVDKYQQRVEKRIDELESGRTCGT